MAINTTNIKQPSDKYSFWEPTWSKARAVVEGDAAVKQFDDNLRNDGSNLLVPFSNAMSALSYKHYKQTAELPGFTSSQRRTVTAALLRKQVGFTLPDGVNQEELTDFINNELYLGTGSFMSLVRDAVHDDLITANAWLLLDWNELTQNPVVEVLPATSVISSTTGLHPTLGYGNLISVVVRKQDVRVVDEKDEKYYTYQEHRINEQGYYEVNTYEEREEELVRTNEEPVVPRRVIEGVETPLDQIPLYPLDGSPEIHNPFLGDFVTREIALYNLQAARNHLLILSSALTPVLTGNISDKAKQSIKDRGLGAVWYLPAEAEVKILETPTAALKDLNSSIEATRQDLIQLGARQLNRDSRASGVAIDLTNSPYTASLSALSRVYSNTLRKVVRDAVNWKTKSNYALSDFNVELSSDLSRSATGQDAVQTVVQLFLAGQLPRTELIQVLKDNSIISSDYVDDSSTFTSVMAGGNADETN